MSHKTILLLEVNASKLTVCVLLYFLLTDVFSISIDALGLSFQFTQTSTIKLHDSFKSVLSAHLNFLKIS